MLRNCSKNTRGNTVRVAATTVHLCLLMSLTGCERMTEIAVISHDPYPVEVYEATKPPAAPRLLRVAGAGSMLDAHLAGVLDTNLYYFTIRRVHGKVIQSIIATGRVLNSHGTLIIGS